jgi:hypothetical protein
MVLTLEGTERLDANLEEGTVNIIEGEEADEGAQQGTVDRKGPICNKIKLRFRRTVAVRGDIMADVFYAVR